MAATSEEAPERLTREHFEIALLDIRLPGMDSLTLNRHVVAAFLASDSPFAPY